MAKKKEIKIGVCIDPHLVERACRCRKDNFFETALGKLDYIASQNDYVVIPGDLMHIHSNSTLFFNTLYALCLKHKDKFHVIPGNHDIFSRNINALNRTTLGSLHYTGAIQLHTTPWELGGVTFVPAMVDTDVDKIPVDEDCKNILVAHKFYNQKFDPAESFFPEDIRRLNYNLVILGHDHMPYEEEFVGNSTVIRMGSLTRIDTQWYNRDREIVYYQITVDTETGKYDYEPQVVPHKPLAEVYTEEAVAKMTATKQENQVISFIQIGDVLTKLARKSDGVNSLDKTLHEIGAPEKVISDIKWRHEMTGVHYT